MDMKRLRVPDFAARKRAGEKIVMLTAYDATMARLLDRAGVDALLVGDSLGTVILGLDTTLPVTLDAVVHHTRAVSRGAERAFVIADMPFLTFQVSVEEAVRNAGRLLQEGGAAAVKLEGGRPVVDAVKRLVDVGIPVMGPDMRNEAARFVTLIDALYEHRVKLLAAADAEPEGLYPKGDGRFEFERTASRLEEMQSADYLGEGHGLAEAA